MPPSLHAPLSRLPSALFRCLHTSTAPTTPFCDVGALACPLKSRSLVAFSGPDTFKFLQGLLTNDVRRLSVSDANSSPYFPTPNLGVGGSPAVYAAMLTPQGRFLYDMFLYRPQRGGEKLDDKGTGPGENRGKEEFDVIADVDATVVDELLDCLKRYRLRSKVEIENVTKDFSCWQRFGKNVDSSAQDPEAAAIGWGSGVDHAGASAAQGNDHGWRWYKDPRLSSLGFRGIFPSCTIPPLVEVDKEADEDHYLLWRLENGVAEGSLEIPKGEAIPLEYNLVGLNAISFEKGCYVGQEFVARTHHRGVIRKRLLPLKFTSNDGGGLKQAVPPGSEVVEAVSKKKVGTVSTVLSAHGMGLLRLDGAFKSPYLSIKDNHDVQVKVKKPDWWPAEWTSDLE